MFKSYAWNLNREQEVIVDSLVSCAPITGKFHRNTGVIPIQHYTLYRYGRLGGITQSG